MLVLVYSKMIQLYIHTLVFIIFSIMVYYRILKIVSVLYNRNFVVDICTCITRGNKFPHVFIDGCYKDRITFLQYKNKMFVS